MSAAITAPPCAHTFARVRAQAALARRLIAEAGAAPDGVRCLVMSIASDPDASDATRQCLARHIELYSDTLAQTGRQAAADATAHAADLLRRSRP